MRNTQYLYWSYQVPTYMIKELENFHAYVFSSSKTTSLYKIAATTTMQWAHKPYRPLIMYKMYR